MIYVITDSYDYDLPINKRGYKIIMTGDEKLENANNVLYVADNPETMEYFLNKRQAYSYFVGMFFLYKNISFIDDDIICIYQKNKKFDMKITDIKKIFADGYNVILPKTDNDEFVIFEQYNLCHNQYDLIDCMNMIKLNYGDNVFNEFFKFITNKNIFYSDLVFAMNAKNFYTFCDFLFKITSKFNARHALYEDKDFIKFAESNMIFLNENAAKYSSYQMQIPKYLCERMASFYMKLFFKSEEIYLQEVVKD